MSFNPIWIIKKLNKKRGASGKTGFYFGVISIVLIGLVVFLSGKVSFKKDNDQFLGSVLKQLVASREERLFFDQKQNLSPQSPDLSVIENNSLASVSSPQLVSGEVLGSAVDGESYSETPHRVQEYEVKEGDTLIGIANKFDISVKTIQWANDIPGSTIVPGQNLIILPVNGVMHSVESGDTVSEIANDYNTKASEIISFNNLSDGADIYIGDVLIVPGGEMPAQPRIYQKIPLASSYFIYPTTGEVSQGAHWPPRYNAVDIANQCGAAIRAVASGTVYQIGYAWPGGRFVKVKHSLSSGTVVSYYGHLANILVSEGQRVVQGQKVGTMGYSGLTIPRGPAGCHLHFDVFGATNPFLFGKGTKIGY